MRDAPQLVRVVPVPRLGTVESLDYQVPDEMDGVAPGTRVVVPIGSRRSMAVVTEELGDSAHRERLKNLVAVLDEAPILDPVLMKLVRWMADYYLAPLGEAIGTALPGALRIIAERSVRLRETDDAAVPRGAESELIALLRDGAQPAHALHKRFGKTAPSMIARLRRKGLVEVVERMAESAPTRMVRYYRAARCVTNEDVCWARRPALRELYAYLRDHPLGRAPAHELNGSFANAAEKLRTLAAMGLVRRVDEETYRDVLPSTVRADRTVTLSPTQSAAVDAIGQASGFAAFLLRGVTGSGKTEVYLHAVAHARERGESALLLVPEISLTHQVVDRVRARFGDAIAVLHSQLSVGERWDEWRRIARGEAPIVIGARSAVFAPLRKLGLIIIDEEHDPAYKQNDGVHYQGRDVAVMRAKLSGCPVVLGSATPAIESYHNAQSGRYQLLELPERVESRPLPKVEIIDLRDDRGSASRARAPVFSNQLTAALRANLAAGGQSLLFLNRRGFASFLQCKACGDPLMCPNCSVALTWHRQWHALRCHYCDHTVARPADCPACGQPTLDTMGVGTEQLEAMLREILPAARIGRMDRDTTRRKGSQRKLLNDWASGSLDVLIGTQMIAKGHDVSGVTLVGVVLADLSLNFPDFRAGERTFQLLAQVAGRAGRGERPGRVIVQTLQPAHDSLRAALTHDFEAYARHELTGRKELGYPPFSRLVLVRIEGEKAADVEQTARDVAAQLREKGKVGVLGPAPAPLERIRQRHRWQILVRSRQSATVRSAVGEALATFQVKARNRGIRLIADVDPASML